MQRFFFYGLLGWGLEILWTAIHDHIWPENGVRDYRLRGHTYLWMFPIYGIAALCFEPIHEVIRSHFWLQRGLTWMLLCYAIEYGSGMALREALGRCPWDYSKGGWDVHGLVCLQHAPLWFSTGLFFERVHDLLLHA